MYFDDQKSSETNLGKNMRITPHKTRLVCAAILINFLSIGCVAQTTTNKNSNVVDTACKNSTIEKSGDLIQFMLNDIKTTYPYIGGGGISEIKQIQTNVFVVSIAQEERIDQLTYELSIDDSCKVSLVKKEKSTVSFGY